ncbi:entericidin [Caulobacter sp. CCUG 60055]|nr:entericidin [Caulobacter sp. CCUG 60055]
MAVADAAAFGDSSERYLMRKVLVSAALMAAALVIAGCNTIAGVGRDVSAAGHAVSSTADDAKR